MSFRSSCQKPLAIVVAAAFVFFAGTSSAHEQIILQEGYESQLDKRVQLRGANQPYTAHHMGVTTERAHTDKHSLKIDMTYRHGLNVYLTPRSNETPEVEWGRPGGAGGFVVPGLGMPLRPDRGYLLTLYMWVERASKSNPVRIEVMTASTGDYGVFRKSTVLEQTFDAPTDGWVKIEQELTSYMLERLHAAGARTDSLRLDGILFGSFAGGRNRATVYIDDITLREVSPEVVDEHRKRTRGQAPSFRSYPEVENLFVWGVYGGLFMPGPTWCLAWDKDRDVRLQQIERMRQSGDWILLDLRRHYCNVLIQGGGMLSPQAEQSSYAYVKAVLDKCAEYGVKLSPSTYLTQHYDKAATKEQCTAAMRKTAGMFQDHPGLLAYWLVDEPGAGWAADDFYWGKTTLDSFDPNHPSLCTCNSIGSIAEFAPTLPIVCIDYYPIGPVPRSDKGCWAVVDSVRYAQKLGAKRIWLLAQMFGGSSWRPPSPEEFRIQLFGALAHGATGFAPYAYANRPKWHEPGTGVSHLIDAYGNPTPQWEDMKRLGRYLRSAGTLLAGAEPLPETAAVAQVRWAVVSNVGRRRPIAIARAFADPKRPARYLVVYNNTRFYPTACNVRVETLGPGEQVLDLFSLRTVPHAGNTFHVAVKPAAGRLYAIAEPATLTAVRNEVVQRRFAIERDLLDLEIRLARRMGTDVTVVEQTRSQADALAKSDKWIEAEGQLAEGTVQLERQAQANVPFRTVNDAVEEVRRTLGRIDAVMTQQIGNDASAFPRTAPDVKAVMDRMIELSKRFYAVQSKLLREGPNGLEAEARKLLEDVESFQCHTKGFLGI